MYRIYLFVLVVVFAFLGIGASAQERCIFNKGKTNYVIIIPEVASRSERTAANILVHYLKEITGISFQVFPDTRAETEREIVIGNTNRTLKNISKRFLKKLEPGGYLFKADGNRIFIAGGSGKGCIHGVTYFLEKYLNVQYLSPDYQIIPISVSFVMKGKHDEIFNPATPIRIVNGPFGRDSMYCYFRHLDNIEEHWGYNREDRYYVHTFDRLVSPREWFVSHPEYFSMINGERVHYGQLCLTNPEIVPIVVKNLKEVMRRNPDIQLWSVSQNDNYYSCTCPNCLAVDREEGSPSGTLLRFVNHIADSFPDKTITTLAYQYTRKPPRLTHPRPNVMITHCSIELNRSLPIADDPESAGFVNELRDWGKICNNIMLWDYEVQFTNYLSPFPLWHTLAPNIRLFNKYGTKAHFQQCNAQHGVEFAELKTWLMSKLLWNPELDAQEIIKDFMQKYYGKAWKPIYEYFNLLQAECLKSGQRLDIYGSPVFHSETFLSAELCRQYNQLFDQAETEAGNDADLLERIKIARLPVWFSEIEIAKTDIFGSRGWYNEVDGKNVVKPEMSSKLDSLFAVSERNKIPYNEKGLNARLYYDNCLRTFNVKTDGNKAFRKPVTVEPMLAAQYTHKGTSMLSNGVCGNEDWKLNWLGWEGKDCRVEIDLEQVTTADSIFISSLQRPDVWILHPLKISCSLSVDGKNYVPLSSLEMAPESADFPMIHEFSFSCTGKDFRYIRFDVQGTKKLPVWHAYAGEKSWVFLDEISVK